MNIKSYRDLEVWKASIDLVEMAYKVSAEFPADERYGLKSQLQRAVVSIPANIAEGYGRLHRAEYIHHLSIASGSLAELETHLIIAARLNFVTRTQAKPIWDHCKRVGQMLRKLIESLKVNSVTTRPIRRTKASPPGSPDRPDRPDRPGVSPGSPDSPGS